MMKSLLKKSKAEPAERERRALERWEKIRARGKFRFVVGTALTYGLTVAGAIDVLNHLFLDWSKASISAERLFVTMFTGFFLAWYLWWHMENDYQRALSEAQAKLPETKNPTATQALP
jgi:hypothetical protein